MDTRNSPLKRIEIIGLNGIRNVKAEFPFPIKILIDENGSGKTTVLFLLVNLLNGNLRRLRKYDFEEIRLSFNELEIVVSKNEVDSLTGSGMLFETLIDEGVLPDRILTDVINGANETPFPTWLRRYSDLIDLISNEIQVSPREFYELAISEGRLSRHASLSRQSRLPFDDQEDNREIRLKIEQIKKLFPYEVLYFPTYRLVEENLINLGHKRRSVRGSQQDYEVQFGMGRVKERFNQVTDEIRRSAVEWYSKINGQMLVQLIGGLEVDSTEYDSISRPNALRIVLDRIGDSVSKSDKATILQLVQTKEIQATRFNALAYFLSNLIKIYEQQREKDEAIKAFVEVTNNYLSDKRIEYDESKVEINPINTTTQSTMGLDQLSSGEKQIVSIFSRLYLDNTKPYAIFFDEPELSLSIEWQRNLLQDIVNSAKCEFLLAATHSPFIFENQLAQYADVLDITFIDPWEPEGEQSVESR